MFRFIFLNYSSIKCSIETIKTEKRLFKTKHNSFKIKESKKIFKKVSFNRYINNTNQMLTMIFFLPSNTKMKNKNWKSAATWYHVIKDYSYICIFFFQKSLHSFFDLTKIINEDEYVLVLWSKKNGTRINKWEAIYIWYEAEEKKWCHEERTSRRSTKRKWLMLD